MVRIEIDGLGRQRSMLIVSGSRADGWATMSGEFDGLVALVTGGAPGSAPRSPTDWPPAEHRSPCWT